jgi:hypothetical protein
MSDGADELTLTAGKVASVDAVVEAALAAAALAGVGTAGAACACAADVAKKPEQYRAATDATVRIRVGMMTDMVGGLIEGACLCAADAGVKRLPRQRQEKPCSCRI